MIIMQQRSNDNKRMHAEGTYYPKDLSPVVLPLAYSDRTA
jgi:hypothetical protein